MIRRVWLDWRSPCLAEAAAWLRDRANASARACDLRRVLCVTPGRRSNRLLLHLLAADCREAGQALVPPLLVTPGEMVDRLLGVPTGDASAPDLIHAWLKALRESEPEALAPFLPTRPDDADLVGWRDLASRIARLRDELAGQLLDFAAVADDLDDLGAPDGEPPRWRALAALEQRYRAVRTAAELEDPHERRLAALDSGASSGAIDEVVLVATIELNGLQRQVLDSFDRPVTSLVHAPESLAARFDDHGCLVTDQWLLAPIDLEDEQIVVCDRPADQAQAAIRAIAALDGRYAAGQISIGLGDENLSPQIERDAAMVGLSVHAARGVPMSRTPPFRLLEVAADWLEEPRFSRLAALLRHADVESWLMRRHRDTSSGIADWLSLLDRYFMDHLQERLSGAWLGNVERQRQLGEVYRAVQSLFEPLAAPPRPLGAWAEPALSILHEVYREHETTPGRTSIALEACLGLRAVLADIARLPASLQPVVPVTEALRLALAAARDLPVASDARADQVEMLGWLELHLDPAPALVVTGVNDGHIPASVHGDPFLPDAVRRRLGLACNERRAARDAYLLLATAHSREHLTLITGRRGLENDPLAPSRLLLATDGRTIARRLRAFCADLAERPDPLPAGLPSPGAVSRFVVPALPETVPPPESMHVTDFRRYLDCPFRFALGRLLSLEAVDDRGGELDPLHFGSLAHAVLDDFGHETGVRDSTDAKPIEAFLADALHQHARDLYGADPMPAVRIQIERLRRRLAAFATTQALLRAEGWAVVHSERRFGDGAALIMTDGEPDMPLRGRIDRIDRHDETGNVRIIDYKTSENARSPHETHQVNAKGDAAGNLEWQDLQLPLYDYLWRQVEPDATVELAYFVLPRRIEEVGIIAADWTPAQLETAIDEARRIIRCIRSGEFEMSDEYASPFDPFARICQTTVFRDIADEAEVEP